MTLHVERIIAPDGTVSTQLVSDTGEVVTNVASIAGGRTSNNLIQHTVITLQDTTQTCVQIKASEAQVSPIATDFVLGSSKQLTWKDYRASASAPIPEVFGFNTLMVPPFPESPIQPGDLITPPVIDQVRDQNNNPIQNVVGYQYRQDLNGFHASIMTAMEFPRAQDFRHSLA